MKKKDWASWWDGMRSQVMKAGAEAIVTNLGGLIATNGVASSIPALSEVAMSWETAILTTIIQFLVRIIVAAAIYVEKNPDPVEIDFPTEIIKEEEDK